LRSRMRIEERDDGEYLSEKIGEFKVEAVFNTLGEMCIMRIEYGGGLIIALRIEEGGFNVRFNGTLVAFIPLNELMKRFESKSFGEKEILDFVKWVESKANRNLK